MMLLRRGLLRVGVLTACVLVAGIDRAQAEPSEESWDDLRAMMFEGRAIAEDSGVIALEAPYRAHDAATVPIGVTSLLGPGDDRRITKLHIIIDENPSPVAGIFELGPKLANGGLETRIRINEYTYVRAIAETSDGALHMAKAFVKAAGGCSAPAGKDPDAAMAKLGKMKLRQSQAEDGLLEARLLIGHPNYSGMQIDQLTRNWIPPDYITKIAISIDGEPVLTAQTDISMSEDPALAFEIGQDVTGTLNVTVEDIEDRRFENSWALGSSS